jgi:hypothetical protein
MTTRVVPRCDCGYVGTPTTPGRLEYSLRQHSCDKHLRTAATAARGKAMREAIDRTRKPCHHKLADHQHGTHACYVLDRCRCVPCAAANTVYESNRVRQQAYGRWDNFVDAEPVRAHVRSLMTAGLGWKRVAALAKLPNSNVETLVYGKRRSDGALRPIRRLKRTNAEALLAVQAHFRVLAGGASVDATGTHRRLQALVVIGWSQNKLCAELGLQRSNFGKMMAGERVTARTARSVAELYERLWCTPPPQSSHRDKISVSRSRNLAHTYGWLPPLAWDDDTIDDPTYAPASSLAGGELVGELDEIAVHRLVNGTLRVDRPSKSPELLEAIRRLAAAGFVDSAIAERTGLNQANVTALRNRNDIAPGSSVSAPAVIATPIERTA